MPKEMNTYMNYINNLKYDECPEYEYLLQLFLNILKNIGGVSEQIFSWADKKKFQSSKNSSSRSKNKKVNIIFQNLLKKSSKKENKIPNLKNMNLKISENNNDTIDFIRTKNISLAINNTSNYTKQKYQKVIINDKDKKKKKIDFINEKIKINNKINTNDKTPKNKLIIYPKKINYKKIGYIPDNNRKKTRKIIQENNIINIYEGLFNKAISRNEIKSYKNHDIIQEHSMNNNSEIRNYINIKNLNINSISNISNIYTDQTNISNNEYKKLDDIERNNINNIKSISSNYINQKLYKPISYTLFSSHINSRENNNILLKNKNNQKVGNSIQLNKLIKTFNSQKYLKSLPITNFLNDNIAYIHKSKMYKSKGLKNNGLTKIIISNPDNNMY